MAKPMEVAKIILRGSGMSRMHLQWFDFITHTTVLSDLPDLRRWLRRYRHPSERWVLNMRWLYWNSVDCQSLSPVEFYTNMRLPQAAKDKVAFCYNCLTRSRNPSFVWTAIFLWSMPFCLARTCEETYLENLEEHVLIDADVESEINQERKQNGQVSQFKSSFRFARPFASGKCRHPFHLSPFGLTLGE